MKKQTKIISSEIKPIKYISFINATIVIPRSFLDKIGCDHEQEVKVSIYEDNSIRLEKVNYCPKCNGTGFLGNYK